MYFADLVPIFTLKLPFLESAVRLQSSVVAKITGKVEVFHNNLVSVLSRHRTASQSG